MAMFNPKLICRLCAKEKEFCVDVFGEDGVKNNLSKKIRLCLPITVSVIDCVHVTRCGYQNYVHSLKVS
jgi:hypothetical protein